MEFLWGYVASYIQRAEGMKSRCRLAERMVVQAEAEIESLRRELADAREEVTALRDAATQTTGVAARLREVEQELSRAQEVRDNALAW
jgi:chromosome segregation ATPase